MARVGQDRWNRLSRQKMRGTPHASIEASDEKARDRAGDEKHASKHCIDGSKV
jgi:hypothetical protein